MGLLKYFVIFLFLKLKRLYLFIISKLKTIVCNTVQHSTTQYNTVQHRRLNQFKIFFVLIIPFFISCEEDLKSDYAIKEEMNVENRTLGCDLTEEVDLKLEKVLGSPCAKLKFIFNGFKDGPHKCTFKYQDVRIYRTLDGNIKNFNTGIDLQYPNDRAVFYSTLDGYIFRKNIGGDELIKVPTLLNNNANTPFEFIIEPNSSIIARIYVCYYAELDCEGTLCTIGPICFTDYIPCL